MTIEDRIRLGQQAALLAADGMFIDIMEALTADASKALLTAPLEADVMPQRLQLYAIQQIERRIRILIDDKKLAETELEKTRGKAR